MPRGNSFSDIESRIDKTSHPDGCWVWLGYKVSGGYGMVGYLGESILVHRLMYTNLVGDIPPNSDLDHLCKNRACCNPAHLEPVSHLENVLRGNTGRHNAEKQFCRNGHAYDTENTVVITGKNNKPERRCRICTREASRRHEKIRPPRSNKGLR